MIEDYFVDEEIQRIYLNNAYNEAINSVPPELRTTELSDVTRKILNSLGLRPSEEIRKLQIKLLSISLNKERQGNLHISFTNILNDLELDEITILRNIHENIYEFVATYDYTKEKGFFNFQYQKFDYPDKELVTPSKFGFYIYRLQSVLKLIKWPIYKQDPLLEEGRQTGEIQLSRLIETQLGQPFNECLFD